MNCEKINCGFFFKSQWIDTSNTIDFQLIQCPVVLFSVVKEYRLWI